MNPIFQNIRSGVLFFIIVAGLIFGCHPTLRDRVSSPEKSLVPIRFFLPKFKDDMDLGSLARAIEMNLQYLDRLDPEYIFIYGPDKYTCSHIRESQEYLLKLISEGADIKKLNKIIRKQYRVYRAAGRVGNNKVLFTAYYEPIYDGNLTPDGIYKYPIYKKPGNL